ncbi:hypothetical protein [Granulicatella elegans]|uniref:hypothetical protein n=1 Tax=Granulicatella elegans TaxID=137732 RepID=UPI001D14C36B|nr:hypothetical protein [Granulicatella elegans]UEA32098.1 hypothetical protein LK443_03980 [Granulicatella elegans]
MDTQKVEHYAGVVRKVSMGLKVWNIIGIVGNGFATAGLAFLLLPSTQEELAKLKNPAFNTETIGLSGAIVVIFLLLCIFSTILYHKIGKTAKQQQLPDKNLLNFAIGIHAFSIVIQLVSQFISPKGFDITAYIVPAIIAGLLGWVYVTYQKWEQEVAKH